MNAQQQLLAAAVACGALRFGRFTLKSGRVSPYFFNAGQFASGASLSALASAYADTLVAAVEPADMLFGPAYKGIPLVAATSQALYLQHGLDLPFAYNRKEAKDHGEGGLLVGAPLRGRVWIIDDVISAGTSVRESVQLIRAAGAEPAGVLVALDRQERGQGERSATQEVTAQFGLPVLAVARLDDLLGYAAADERLNEHAAALRAYRAEYGIAD
jgi:orotate phosphoribosyltransferase